MVSNYWVSRFLLFFFKVYWTFYLADSEDPDWSLRPA